MTSARWEGTATAVTSIVHGDQALGTVTYLRRERFLMPDGTTDEIPVVSGNAWRGLLRRTAADLWWDAAGRPPLTLAVAHAIWGGGALAKSTGAPLTGARLLRLRSACPVIGLFGAAGGGRIIDGCVLVGKLIPACRETAHLLPDWLASDPLPTIWDLTQIEQYRKAPADPTPAGPASTSDGSAPPARFGVETFIAGTRFHAWLAVEWPAPGERALLDEALAAYRASARVGGMARAGHGEIRLDLQQTTGAPPSNAGWRASVTAEPDLQEVLAWLD